MKQKNKQYHMPAEWEEHEGTWLVWPHNYTSWGAHYRDELENIWVQMTQALHEGEKVHIIVYDKNEKKHVHDVLENLKLNMNNINLLIIPADDVWVRDSGPVFIYDNEDNLLMTDWNFNGWGAKYPYQLDRQVSKKISEVTNIPILDTKICLECGGIEVNGSGTFMAAKTSIINDNRNPGLSQKEIEEEISKYFGVSNFVWITGIRGEDNGDEDTDFHIDGAARFANKNTVFYEYDPFGIAEDYLAEAHEKHYQEIRKCKTEDGELLNLIPLPLSRKIIERAGCQGSYCNYYIGNKVVLVPTYNDVNDALALKIIEGQFPGRKIVPIDVCKLYPYGGMIHCVTQQQPIDKKAE